jgi:hypothetical protein
VEPEGTKNVTPVGSALDDMEERPDGSLDWDSSGANQQTPDLAALVQEIVDQDGWTEGNAVSFILSGYGTRSAESFEGSKDNAEQIPTLYLWYTKPPDDDTPPVIVVNIEDGDILEKISEFKLICEAIDEQSGIATFAAYLDNAVIEPHSILMLDSMAFGEHQLVLVATDNAGNETMIELKFVIDASIDTLVWLLENYFEDGYITNHWIFNSLKKKVEKGHLNAFINQLHAKDGKKHIDSEQLMILLEYAEYLK